MVLVLIFNYAARNEGDRVEDTFSFLADH